MDIKNALEEAKARIENGCRTLDRKIEERLRRSHLLSGDGCLMEECAATIAAMYCARGYTTQSFRFTEDGTVGTLVQIGNPVAGWKHRIATAISGQQLAVNVRLLPKGDDLEVSVDCGKWVDKALSGVLAWAVFAPLLIFPVAGLWRQRRLIERVERETLEWLAARHRAGCIDV